MLDTWYLATPYGKYPGGLHEAFLLACHAAAALIRAKVPVFCPVAHSHPVAIHGGLDARDYKIWEPADRPFVEACKGIVILRAISWERSVGIEHERNEFQKNGRPIVYMDPFDVPDELLTIK